MSKIEIHVFITTTNGDDDYTHFKLMFSPGIQNPDTGYVGAIAGPIPVKNITLDAAVHDPVFFSYPYNPDNESAIVRGLLADIDSKGGDIPSTCKIRLVEVPDPASDVWRYDLSGDIRLRYLKPVPPNNPDDPPPPPVETDLLTNPQGIAVIGNYIFGLDYDSQVLTILGVNELLGRSGDVTPVNGPYDMSTLLARLLNDDTGNARGRAIIALGNKLYPLFINYFKERGDNWVHGPGIITRFGVSGTVLTDDQIVYVGMNPQEVVPGIDGSGNTWLFIPAIGGEQTTDDSDSLGANGTESNICVVPAEGDWPINEEATILLTGDPNETLGLTEVYDIHDIAIICRDENSFVYILTAKYGGESYASLYYRIYLTTVDVLLSLNPPGPGPDGAGVPAGPDDPLPSPPTLSQAKEAGKLVVVDEGEVVSDPSDPEGLYHPSINIIQHPADPEKDLIVVCTGSMILVTRALAYGSPTAVKQLVPPPLPEPNSGTDPDPATTPVSSKNNPYTLFGNEGGVNMNSIDITIETLYQAKRGNVSLKRGGRTSRPGGAAGMAATSAARLGTAAPATPAKEEGEEK
jgi:hypothetical protein